MTAFNYSRSSVLRGMQMFLVCLALVLTGCEDDPILEAPSGAASSGGSYGKLSIDTSGKTVREIQLNEQRTNPVTF